MPPTARRKFAERFAEASPAGIGDKGEARPIAEWRAAFAAVGEEVASADTAIRDAERKQRELDREIARLEQDRAQKPPSKLEVRIELAAAAATKATLRVTYAVRNARWTPLYDARLDTGAKDRKPALELVRRAEITQNTGEDWSNVALAVSTVRTARGGSAPDLKSLSCNIRNCRVRWPRRSASDMPSAAPRAAAAAPRRRRQARGARDGEGRRATGRGRSQRLPGGVQDSRARQPRRQRRRQEPARLQREHCARSRGPRRAGAGPDRVPRSELQADRGRAAVAGPGRDLSRRRVRRPRPDGGRRQGRDRAARLRRRRQDQDRAHRRSSATRARPA